MLRATLVAAAAAANHDANEDSLAYNLSVMHCVAGSVIDQKSTVQST